MRAVAMSFGIGPWAEPGKMGRVIPRGNNFKDPQAIFAVSHERECAGSHHSDFHVVDIIELAAGS